MSELDDVLNDLLGELNDLTVQLETNDPTARSSRPPPPPAADAKPTMTTSNFPPPPPPPPIVNTGPAADANSFPPPPPPPPASMKPSSHVVEDDNADFLPPPPPPEVALAAQDQEDLSAMLDDLASFTDDFKSEENSTVAPLPSQNGTLHASPHNSQQFSTLRRTGASYVQPNSMVDNDDEDMTLESLAKDIEYSKEEDQMPNEAELANLSPVTTAKLDVKPALPVKPKVAAGPPPLPPKPEKSILRTPSVSQDNLQYASQDSLSTTSSGSRRSLRTDSTISSAATSMLEFTAPKRSSGEQRSVSFALNLDTTMSSREPVDDNVSVPSVDSGIDNNIVQHEETPEEREERIKSEKVRIALEKMKEARIQKLCVKVFNEDQSSKTMMIDERMTTRTIVNSLLEKNHFDFSPDWTLMEEFPSLYMERMFEEHEKPCDFLSYWTRDSSNQLRLLERKDKYALFKTPQRYLLPLSDAQDRMQERQKQSLIEEFFSGGGTSSLVPEVQGWLHIKGDSKSWSRKYCILRSSGLYVSKTGEPKKGKRVGDLSCLVMFEHIQLYHGRGWKKKFKSPFDYGFALKHPSIQVKSKQIKYLCCEDFATYMTWTVGIRLAKNGKQLHENYRKTQEDLKSTSVVTSHLAMRQQQQNAESQARKKSQDMSGDSRSTTTSSSTNSVAGISKPVGVKSIFEGAWQRAEEGEDSDSGNGSFGSKSGRMSMRQRKLQERRRILNNQSQG